MSIPGFGDAVTLFDTSIRIISFINDLRHAQDDLLGLASEAHALRICINAVTSDSCHQTLYTYISKDQGRDLKTIVRTCDQNLEDLNRFIASVAVLVEKKGRRDGILGKFVRGKSRPGAIWKKRKSWTAPIRKAFAKCWAAYKFTMTDKQAFRDKLILPTQSINIFLTSMTHVGLVNMGRFIGPGGGISTLPRPQPPSLLPPADTPSANKGGQKNAKPEPMGHQLGDWEVVGSQVAFRKPSFTLKGSTISPDFEAEVLLYAKHLAKGGERFSYVFEKHRRHFKVTKTPVDKTSPKPRSRSRARSKSRQPSRGRNSLSLGKDSKGTFVRKKKTVVVPSGIDAETETLVTLDDQRPRRPLLALPAPDVIEIKPSEWESDSDGGHSSHNSSDSDGPGGGRSGGGGGGPPRRRRLSGPPDSDSGSPPPRRDNNEPDMNNDQSGFTGARASGPGHARSRWQERATYRHSSVRDLEEQRRKVEERIQREQDEAMHMAERFEEPARAWRRSTLRRDTHLSEAEKADIDEFQDLADSMFYLGETYGVTVSPAGDRPAVDNGAVDSDDENIKYDPELSHVDKLKAETSIPMREKETDSINRKPDPSYYVEASLRSRMRPEAESRYARQGYSNPLYESYAEPVPEEYLKYSSRPYEHYSHRPRSWSPVRSEEGLRYRQPRRSRSPPDGDREYHEREWYGPGPGRRPSGRYDSGLDPSHRYAEFGPGITVDFEPRDPRHRQRAPYEGPELRRPSEHYRERPSFADESGAEIHLREDPRPGREKRRPTDLHREREMDILQPESDQTRLRRPIIRRAARDEVPYERETYEKYVRRDEDEASAAVGGAGPSDVERRRKGKERSSFAVEVEVDEDERDSGRAKRRRHRPSMSLGSEAGGGTEERLYMSGGRGRDSESDEGDDDAVLHIVK